MPAPPNDLSQRRADFVGAVSRSGQMITLKQLQVFTAVAERQHMTQASYDLGMAQSAVSATVAPLETNLGCSLFARIGRGITLTPSGRFFLGEANAILDRIAAATCEVKLVGSALCAFGLDCILVSPNLDSINNEGMWNVHRTIASLSSYD